MCYTHTPGRECPAGSQLKFLPSREGTLAQRECSPGVWVPGRGWQPGVVLGTYFQAVAGVTVTSQMPTCSSAVKSVYES